MSQEQVAELVNSGEFKKALKLAQKNNLDTDYIYKRQWESIERIFEDDVTDVLANVKDNTWVMDQCLMRTATDEKANETLINLGIQRNSHCIITSSDDALSDIEDLPEWEKLNEKQKILVQKRMQLIEYRDKLKVFVQVTDNTDKEFEQDAFHEFKEQIFEEYCCDLAISRNWPILELVLTHVHDDATVLQILDRIPESTPISEYQDMMPVNDNGRLKLEWDRDTELDFTEKYLKRDQANISKFYLNRTIRIAELLPSYGQEFLSVARAKQVPDSELNEVKLELEQLCYIVYDLGEDYSLEEFRNLPEDEKFEKIMTNATPEALASRLKLFPPSRDVIYSFVQKQKERGDLTMCVAALKSNVITGDKKIELALDVAYNVDMKTNYVTLLSDIAQDLPEKTKNADLQKRLDQFDKDWRSLETLAKFNLHHKISALRELSSNDELIKEEIQKIIQHCVKNNVSENEFQNMYYDLVELHNTTFHRVPLEYIWHEYALNCCLMGHLDLVTDFLQADALSEEEIDSIALDAARQLINSAYTAQDKGLETAKRIIKYHDTQLEKKYNVGKWEEELHLLQVLELLSRHFTTYKLPIEIRILKKNKKTIDIIRHLMENNRGSELEHIVEVGKLVGLDENDVRFNAADYVFHRRNDFNLALSIVEELVEVNYAPAYRLAFKLASNEISGLSLNKRLDLMSFSSANCPVTDISEIIGYYRNLETRQMAEVFGVSFKQTKNAQDALTTITSTIKPTKPVVEPFVHPFYFPSTANVKAKEWKISKSEVLHRALTLQNKQSDLTQLCGNADIELLVAYLPYLSNDVFEECVANGHWEMCKLAQFYHAVCILKENNALNEKVLTTLSMPSVIDMALEKESPHKEKISFYQGVERMVKEATSIGEKIGQTVDAKKYVNDSRYRSFAITALADTDVESAVNLAKINNVDASNVYLRHVTGMLTEGSSNKTEIEETLQNVSQDDVKKLLTQILKDRTIPGTDLDRLQYIYSLLEKYSSDSVTKQYGQALANLQHASVLINFYELMDVSSIQQLFTLLNPVTNISNIKDIVSVVLNLPNLSRMSVTKSMLYLNLIEKVLVNDNIQIQGRIQQCETLIPELSAEDMTKLVHIINAGSLPVPNNVRVPLFEIILKNLTNVNAEENIITETKNLIFRLKAASRLLKVEDTQVTWHLFLENKIDIITGLAQVMLTMKTLTSVDSSLQTLNEEYSAVYGQVENGPEFTTLTTNKAVHAIVQQLLDIMNEVHTEDVEDEEEDDEIIFPPQPSKAASHLSMILEITKGNEIHDEIVDVLHKFSVDERARVSAKISVLKLIQVEKKPTEQGEEKDEGLLKLYQTSQIIEEAKFEPNLLSLLSQPIEKDSIKWVQEFDELLSHAETPQQFQALSAIITLWKDSGSEVLRDALFILLSQLSKSKKDDLLLQIASEHDVDPETELKVFEHLKQRTDNPLLACRYALKSPHDVTRNLVPEYITNKPALVKSSDFNELFVLCIANNMETSLILSSVAIQDKLLSGKRVPDAKMELLMICRCVTTNNTLLLFATQYVSNLFGISGTLSHFVNNRFVLVTYLEQSWSLWRRNDPTLSKMCETALLHLK